MRGPRAIVLVGCLLTCMASPAQRTDWLPISQRDQQIKEVPGAPGAAAIQLYYMQDIDDSSEDNEGERIYKRVKILNEKGNRYADVKITVSAGYRVQDLKARTVHPDGKIIEFSGKPLDQVISKGNGYKVMGKSFTFPDVTPGSIVEYRYKLDYPSNTLPPHVWLVQHELYTVKEYFRIRPYTGIIDGTAGGTGISLSIQLPDHIRPQRKGEGFELEVHDIPAFEPEPSMPPEDSYIYRVNLFYGGKELRSADEFWQTAGNKWNDEVESFIGNRREVREAAAAAIGSESDPEKRLQALYRRSQQIRNLSYERERTRLEQKKEDLKLNRNVAEVLSRGYGDREDVTRLFVALAMTAGFDANVVRVGNRAERFFDKSIMVDGQLDSEIAMVNLNGRNLFLDPGTRFCPFGQLRWIRTSMKGWRIAKAGGFVDVPGMAQDKTRLQRTVDASLTADGSLQGGITVLYRGFESLERRLDALDTDDAGRNKSLEDEMKEWLPNGSAVKVNEVKGWEGSDEPLEADFTFNIPSFASVSGKRLLVSASVFQSRQKDSFATQGRKYPVYFPFAFSEMDTATITVPAGYALETAPAPVQAKASAVTYQSEIQVSGTKLTARRQLVVNGIFFRPEQYSEIRSFFSQVRLGDEQQTVFQGGDVHAQKAN